MSLTKGFIRNNENGAVRNFMFNPTDYSYKRSATYNEISSPGSPYPVIAFNKGDLTEIPVKLFLSDRAGNGEIESFIDFIEGLFPEENSNAVYKRPTTLTISMGHLIKVCVLISMDVSIKEYNKYGKPILSEISLDLKVVA